MSFLYTFVICCRRCYESIVVNGLYPLSCTSITIKMADTEKRSLKIKANTVGRIVKELQMYEKDLVKEQSKYEALKDQGADAHDLKYAVRGCAATSWCLQTPPQEKLLTEASMMIPDTKARLTTAVTELQAFLVCSLQQILRDNGIACYRMRCASDCQAPRSWTQQQRRCRAQVQCLQTGRPKKPE